MGLGSWKAVVFVMPTKFADLFEKIAASTHLPIVAVGGINTENIKEVMGRGKFIFYF